MEGELYDIHCFGKFGGYVYVYFTDYFFLIVVIVVV